MENVCLRVREEAKKLHQAIADHNFDEMNKSSRTISDHVHRLAGHCNINLVNDSLRNWQAALKEGGTTELNAVSIPLTIIAIIEINPMPHRVLYVTDWRSMCCLWKLMLMEQLLTCLNNVSFKIIPHKRLVFLSHYSHPLYFL